MARERRQSRDLTSCHIAVEAARSVGLVAEGPIEASVLKRSTKSLVVRIRPPGGPAIVAKRSRSSRALAEARVYDEVLSLLSEGHVQLLDRSVGEKTGWLFLEDAGDVEVDTDEPVVRRDLGALLGRSAALTSRTPLNGVLPQYTSEYFNAVLADAQRRLSAAAATQLANQSCVVLTDALHRLERVEASWPTIASVFVESPEVLCHADLMPKNIRLRGPQRDLILLDWELAGRGPLAVDVGCLAVTHDEDPLLLGIRREFPHPGRPLGESARFGRMLRLVHAVQWSAVELGTASAARGVHQIETYLSRLDQAIAQLVDAGAQRW